MSKRSKTILVTGATGRQGGAVLKHLRERGFPVRAVTRDPDRPEARRLASPGTEVVRGDLSDTASLSRALDGASGVYSVQDSKPGGETEIQQGLNLVNIANRLRIDHLVYSSVASADRNTRIPHFESKFRLEEHIRNSGLHYSIFRPVFFMENLLGMKSAIEQGTFSMPLDPQTRLQVIAVDDIGAFVAMAFEHPGSWGNQVTELAGDELSMQEIADSFGRISGHPVRYSQIPWDEFERQSGRAYTIMYRWFQQEGYHVDIARLRQHRQQLLTFDRWLSLNWSRAGAAGSTMSH